jgi:hypothetical protein
MRIFKTRWFHRWAAKEGLSDPALAAAARELEQGLGDAMGGFVYKKRIALPGRGKRGGARTLIAYRRGQAVFFMYGFPKNEGIAIAGQGIVGIRRARPDEGRRGQ